MPANDVSNYYSTQNIECSELAFDGATLWTTHKHELPSNECFKRSAKLELLQKSGGDARLADQLLKLKYSTIATFCPPVYY